MKVLLASLAVCALVSCVFCAVGGNWCYHDSSCNDATWPTTFPQYCSGSRQSPINIITDDVTTVTRPDFAFVGYSDKNALDKITNTGKTVKVTLQSGKVKLSGGGLPEQYDALQFHLHWGNGHTIPGSEHTVDGKRYPMELHIVHAKSKYNGNTTAAVADSEGLAALGFFIQESKGDETNSPESWRKLTSYLSNILTSGTEFDISSSQISLDDLIGNVNREKFYRYLGSLTTPACNEAVVWTVFKEPIEISKDLLKLFGSTVRIGDSSSALMRNVYRNIQPAQTVTYSGGSRSVAFPAVLVLITLPLVQLWA